jgi:hypothetical protein
VFRFGDPGGRMYQNVGTSNSNILTHWTNISGTWTVNANTSRTSGSSLRVTNANSALFKTLDAQPTWGMALALRMTAGVLVFNFNNPVDVIQFLDVSTAQLGLRIESNTGLFYIHSNGTTLTSKVGPGLTPGAWVHLEIKGTIHPTAGTVQLWINGVQTINLTNVNTRGTANSSANQISINLNNNGTQTWDVDDIIVYDGQATDPNGYSALTGPVGDCGLAWILPTGDGALAQFARSTGTTGYNLVNDVTPDGDTSYVESSTVGQIDTYTMADLPATATGVKGVALCHLARKNDVGSRQLGALIRSGGTNYIHPTGVDLGNTYLMSFRNYDSNPSGGVAWVPAAVNALEAGQRVNS